MFDAPVKEALLAARSIAIVGAKDKPSQPVDMVGRYLIKAGYTVYPVHPVRDNVWGLTTYKTVLDIPEPVDIVNLFRAAEFCPAHAREVLTMRTLPRMFWMQSGIRSEEAGRLMAENGISVVEDKCIMVEHQRLGVR